MRSLRTTASALTLLLIITLSASLSAQVTKRGSATDLNTHKFQPQGMSTQARSTPSAKPATISPSALQQINALLLDKKQRTPTQAKISSRVLYTSRMLQGLPAAIGVPYLRSGLELDAHNNLYLDITARVTDGLLKQLRAMGVRIIRSSPRSIRAFVPPYQVESVASLPGVIFIQPRQQAMTQEAMSHRSTKGSGPAVVQQLPPGFAQRAATVRQKLSHALTNGKLSRPLTNGTGQGSVTTEGDATHRAADARSAFGVNGAGLNIGVLSDGASSLAASQATGDLPPTCPAGPPCVTVLPGQTGSGDEGTAMMEIIHDLAPGANLFFATAFNGIDSFAQNIRDLRTAGCDIIVDDVFYFVETPFQDGQAPSVVSDTDGGVVIQAVNDVTADGAMYFSSAGNQGNLDDAFSGTFEGDFVDAGPNPLLPGGTVAMFGTNPFDTITFDGGNPFFLFWADPLGGSANDYDLFILDSTGTTILDASTDLQDGTQDPIEAVFDEPAGNLVVVFKVTGAADRFFHLDTFGGALEVVTAGQTHGHSSAAAAFSVAATPAFLAIAPGFPTGPFPNPFNAANVVEPYSSDGPRQIFFEADGTPITPGNFSSTGGLIRQKPDVTAADGVSVTGVGGFPSPFYGTSAAAPHAAAIAGLVKSAVPTLTNDQVRTALTSTAVDIEAAGVDRDSGAGIVDAFEAVHSVAPSGFANPELGNITATETSGNGDGAIEAGEAANLTIELKNTAGAADATGITATLTTATPGVTITQGTSAYPDLPAGTGIATNTTPFAFSIVFNAACGLTIDFTLTINYTGGPSPRVLTFSLPTGPPPINVLTTLDTTAPTPVTGVTTATGLQTGRIFRDGNPSVCGAPKTFPGVFDPTGSRQYDAYTFNACRNTCAEITVSNQSVNAFSLFSAAYSPSFTPGDTSVNYVGDAGVSGASTEYGIDTLGGTAYTVVIHELDPGLGVGSVYNVQISGCSISCDFMVPATISPITVTAGQSGTQHFTITPSSSFDVPITFTCSGLPAHSSCSFSPASVTPGSSMADVAVTIDTTAPMRAQLGQRNAPIYALWLPFGGLGLITMAGVGTRKRSRKVLIALALLLLIPTLLAIVSCGSSARLVNGTPPGTYNVTVTSTSGAAVHNSSLSLTVQ
ncbi:MAG: S8 family serine peptidase [Acidobacteriia bacterium]|nr:S8 family serine peptidase [Terriglobia bacterium]